MWSRLRETWNRPKVTVKVEQFSSKRPLTPDNPRWVWVSLCDPNRIVVLCPYMDFAVVETKRIKRIGSYKKLGVWGPSGRLRRFSCQCRVHQNVDLILEGWTPPR